MIAGVTRTAVALAVAATAVGSAAAAPSITTASVDPVGVWTSASTVTATWTVQGAEPFLSGVRLEVNDAPDGSADGAWITLQTQTPITTTDGSITAPLGTIEGRRALRLVAWDQSGVTIRFLGTGWFDRQAPRVSRPVFTPHGPHSGSYAWTHDVGGHAPPVPNALLEVERDTDGLADGPWIAIAIPLGPGTNTAQVDLPGLPDGTHAVRLRSADAAGNDGVSALPALVVDHTPPVISGVRVAQMPTATSPALRLEYEAEDAPVPLPPQTVARLVDVDRAVTLTSAASGPGTQSIWADLPIGQTRRLVVVIQDAAGNVGRSDPLTVTGSPSGGGSASPVDPLELELAGAELTVVTPVGGWPGPLRYRQPFLLSGQLRDRTGTGMPRREIEVRDRNQRVVGRTLTNPDGTFVATARPVRSGRLDIGVPVSGELLPRTRPPGPSVSVHPRLTLTAAPTTVRVGGVPLQLTGTVRPSPGMLGIDAKNVVLEWRDPFRGVWRPMLNGRVRANGTITARWRFGAGGFAVPIRLRLPAEPGWPTRPGLSHPVTIRVK